MKVQIIRLQWSLLVLLFTTVSNPAHSQCNPVYGTEFSIFIDNILLTSDRTLEFDVRIIRTGSQPFELAAVQCGINIDPALYAGGTLTAGIVAGSSDLVAAQVPTSITYTGTGSPPPYVIKLAPRPAPGAGSGTSISSEYPYTRIVRLKLNSTAPFYLIYPPGFYFQPNTALTPQYPTKVAKYSSGIVPLAVNMGVNAYICYNAFGWNPTPYPVTGGGSYCQGGEGLPVSLANSESGVAYYLVKDGVTQFPEVYGTGSAITFGNQLAGTYTVIGFAPNVPSSAMIGSSVITETPSVLAGVSISPDANYTCPGTPVTLTASPINGGTGPVYQWFVNNVSIGTGPAYSYTPADGDQVYVKMTSNATCSAGSPASSNIVQMEVNEPSTKTIILSSIFLEGLYNGAGTLRQASDQFGAHFGPGIADHITVELHDALEYNNPLVFSSIVDLSILGRAIITLPDIYSGSYYITIRHRNSIETVSATPVSVDGCAICYSLADPANVFGSNLQFMESGRYAIFSGDVNHDGIIDSGDMAAVDNLSEIAATGYIIEDANGDGLIDSGDMAILDNNAASAISKIVPQ